MELVCDKSEVLRYLGHRGQDIREDIDALIDDTIYEAKSICSPRYCLIESGVLEKEDGIYVSECNFYLSGESIKKHLNGMNRIYLFAATLGTGIDNKIRLWENKDLTRAIILDCAGSAMIESYCDSVCSSLAEESLKKGIYLTSRFSPGYGDLPLSLQKNLLNATDAERRIGLTCNDQFLMFPRKSVTAIMGFGEKELTNCKKSSCESCTARDNCFYKRNA